ncbi:MAG: methyltransferase, partial [Methylobacterium sp.]|nr:methyltransferase [Methylobacterium sp.]
MAALADRFYAIRDLVAASPRFQRFAARFPLTRPVATRQAAAVFDLCAGFVYAQILRAAVDLRLLERLRDGPRTTADLAPELALSEASAARLLKATTSLGLTAARRGGRYGLGMKGAALLGNPGALRMIEHHHLLYADLADPVRLLRGEAGRTALQDYWGYATAGHP